MQAVKKDEDHGMPRGLLDALTTLRIARDRLREAKKEKNRRHDLSLDWMREKPTRTVGEAWAYVGIASAEDAVRDARRSLNEAVEGLLSGAFDLNARRERGEF